MVDAGHAYHCFCTQEELSEMREDAVERNESTRYDGRCRSLPRDEVERRLLKKVPHVLRLKIPEGETRFRDVIRDKFCVRNSELDDFVLIKSDGRPTYDFAVVVDDARMKITHVIRGDDHLSNTPKQVLLYRALEYPLPKFAHLPMILGSDRSRLSKRHGAESIQEYRRRGYSSDALINYLALLGWSLDGKTEYFTRKSLIGKFSLKRVTKNPTAFDPDKLDYINGEHFKRMNAMEKVGRVYEKLAEEKLIPPDFRAKEWTPAEPADSANDRSELDRFYREERPRLAFILKVMGHRLKNLDEVRAKLAYFYTDDYPRSEAAYRQFLSNADTGPRLCRMAELLSDLEPFERSGIEHAVRELAGEMNIEAADLIHPCRVALTGDGVSPDIFSVIHLIGRDKCVERLRAEAVRIMSGERPLTGSRPDPCGRFPA